ncbi:MAG: exo-alpha-sialidase, partial [Muribaculaceae bacterium]|nr:exo-alpha-sialidase [Muribaculaceae bacterium]
MTTFVLYLIPDMVKIPHIAFLLAACLTLMFDSTAQTVVFDTDVTAGRYYRIPALVQLHDGRLLAIGDDRHGSDYDIGGNHGIDIVGRFGDDKGVTWGEPFMIADGDGRREGFHDSHGDAAAVVDRETGQVLIMCASGYQGFLHSTLQEPLLVGRYISGDGGKTWTGDDVTSGIYGIFAGFPEVNALFF